MKAFLVISCLLATALSQGIDQGPEAYVKTHLTGHWKENQYQRNGLNNFLYEMGMNWFKRVYVTSSSWENQQHITYRQAGNPTWSVSGIKGPREDAFNFDLVPDYNTQTSVDLGQLGGRTFAKARYEGNKLITHIHNIKTGRHFLTAIREVKSPNHMVYTTTHLGSGKSLVSQFYRCVTPACNKTRQ